MHHNGLVGKSTHVVNAQIGGGTIAQNKILDGEGRTNKR
jgi:hypothetical protein